MPNAEKQFKKIMKQLDKAQLCTTRKEANKIVRKYTKAVAKLNKAKAEEQCHTKL